MQYEIVFKVIGGSCYTWLPRTLPAAARTSRNMAAPGTGPKAPRLLTIATPKHSPAHTHTCKQGQNLRNSTTLQKNSTQNYARTILRVTTIAWI
jgi:hypothetical protein